QAFAMDTGATGKVGTMICNRQINLISVPHHCARLHAFGRARARTAERVEPSVRSSDSLGMLVTKGPTSHPRPVGISRVKEIDSHSTYTPPSRSTKRQ